MIQCVFSRLTRVIEYGVGAMPSDVIGNRLVPGGSPPLTFQDSDVLLQTIVCTRNGRFFVTMKQARCPGLCTLNDVIDDGRILREVRLQICQVVEIVLHVLGHLDASMSPPTLFRAGYVQHRS